MKTYNWGIIGTGFIGQKLAEALAFVPQSKVYAVASRNIETANIFAEKYNCKAYGTYEELANDPEVDIIHIATPHNLHCENTLMCLNKGKHVLCEKPFAINGKEVRKMIDAAKANNVFLMDALWTRFNPNIIKVKKILDSGILGKVTLLKTDFGERKPYHPENRFFSKELTGGSLIDMGIYPLFVSIFMLGKPTKITATAGIGKTGVDTNTSFVLGYDDDKLAVISSSIVADTESAATIYCEKGHIHMSQYIYAPAKISIKMLDGESEDITEKLVGNIYNYEAVEVIECLEKGKIQSDKMSWEDTLVIIDSLDEIRRQIGLVFDAHDL